MISKEQAFEYEMESLTFTQSMMHKYFFNYFVRRFERKYNRYKDYMYMSMYDRTVEYFKKIKTVNHG